MNKIWKGLVVLALVLDITIITLSIARQIFWLNYEHNLCLDSLDDMQTGTCQLEMDAPLEFHWYWVPEV